MSIARLHHRILGLNTDKSAAAPLVLIHGLMGFAANWGKIWPYFQETRPVLVLDQRGHGRSEKPPSGYSPSDYSEDLAHLLKEIGWSRAHIVGHSMGGRVALRFVSDYPEHSLSLTMEDSGAEANPDRVKWIENLLGEVPTPFHDREKTKRFFEENYRHDPMTGSFLHANLETKQNGGKETGPGSEEAQKYVNRFTTLKAIKVDNEALNPASCDRAQSRMSLEFWGVGNRKEALFFQYKPEGKAKGKAGAMTVCNTARDALFTVHRDLIPYLETPVEALKQ